MIESFIRRWLGAGKKAPAAAARPSPAPSLCAPPAVPPAVTVLDIQNWYGSVEHYYHFLLGFLAPLVLRPEESGTRARLVVRSCGPMDAHLAALDLPGLEIVPRDEHARLVGSGGGSGGVRVEQLWGYDDPDNYDAASFTRLRQLVFERLGTATPERDPGSVLLIGRGPSPDYYQSENAEVKTSAGLRRSIPNMAELAQAAADCGLRPAVIELEQMDLRGQIQLFARAGIVVAQHGAALANMLWMAPGAIIIEFNPKGAADPFVNYFRALADACGHAYRCIPQAGNHANADPAALARVLRGDQGDQPVTRGAAAASGDKAWPLAAQPLSRLNLPGWNRRFETRRAAMAQRKIDLVWIGDTIAQQFETAGPEDWRNYRPVWNQFYGHRNALNLGFAGDDTRAVLWRVQNGGLETIAPRLVILVAGTNNFINKAHKAAATFAGIDRVAGELRARMPASKILVLGVLPSIRGLWVERQTITLNGLLAEHFATVPNTVFADARPLFLKNDAIDPDCYTDRLRTPPRAPVHPTAAMQARLAEFIEPIVARAMG